MAMRFVLTLTFLATLSSNSFAAPWDVVPLKDARTSISQTAERPVQMQRGGSANTLHTINGLELNIAATGLGNISAMALGKDGTLYAADRKSGRIWSLPDRRQNGKIDLRRPLPFTFNAPSGLAIIEGIIYVADRNAVWTIEPGQAPRQLASLARANSTGEAHILLVNPDNKKLTLGLTTAKQKFQLLSLNKDTGEARLIAGDIDGKLHSLAQRKGSEIWVSSGATLGPLGSSPLNFRRGQSIASIVLPGQYETPQNWPVKLKDHIIATQLGPDAMQLIAIPSEFGQASGTPRILVKGFLTTTGRVAWGQPGPIIMDKRGLFFADAHNGTLWRLSPKPAPQAKIMIVDTANLPPNPNAEPKLTAQDKALTISSSIKGTQIDAKSTIIQPSSIIYGSKLIKDYDEKKALEDAEKAESKPKKKRRMSRKRKQPEK